jgi:hypothetical protein
MTTKPSTTSQETRELAPCPRGHAGAQVCNSDERMFYVTCVDRECFWALGEGYDRDARPDHAFRSEEEAAEAWNTRAPSDTEQVIRLREALRVIRDYRNTCMICVGDPKDTELDATYRDGARAVLDNVAVMARAALQPKAETELEQL